MNAVCHRCGGAKAGPLLPCPNCKITPKGADRAVAWLFSLSHLDEHELDLAGQRIREGEIPDPPASLRTLALQHIGMDFDDTPLNQRDRIRLIAANVVLTPLVGLAVWWGLSGSRPTAAKQALHITVPIAAAFALVWLGLIATRLLG